MERQSFPLVAHIHDETVNEVPEEGADEQAAEINRIMSTAPEWAEGLPVASGTDVTDYYCKK
jgi:DNA polymerase